MPLNQGVRTGPTADLDLASDSPRYNPQHSHRLADWSWQARNKNLVSFSLHIGSYITDPFLIKKQKLNQVQ